MKIVTQIFFEFFSVKFIEVYNESQSKFQLEIHSKTDKIVFQIQKHIEAIIQMWIIAITQKRYQIYLNRVEFVYNTDRNLSLEYDFKYIDMNVSDCKELLKYLINIQVVLQNANN